METAEEQTPHGAAHALHAPGEEEHPGPATYIKVAVVLAVVTAFEVAVYYVGPLRPLLAPLLLSMSFLKFSLVVLYFMHLKFDSRWFRRVFVSGIILAAIVYAVALSTLGVWFLK